MLSWFITESLIRDITPVFSGELALCVCNSNWFLTWHVARRRGGDWFRCDDAAIVLVPETEVLSSQAYLLLYNVAS
jgi:hypothetical protein